MSSFSRSLPIAAGQTVGFSCYARAFQLPPQAAFDLSIKLDTGDTYDLATLAALPVSIGPRETPFSRLEITNRAATDQVLKIIVGDQDVKV